MRTYVSVDSTKGRKTEIKATSSYIHKERKNATKQKVRHNSKKSLSKTHNKSKCHSQVPRDTSQPKSGGECIPCSLYTIFAIVRITEQHSLLSHGAAVERRGKGFRGSRARSPGELPSPRHRSADTHAVRRLRWLGKKENMMISVSAEGVFSHRLGALRSLDGGDIFVLFLRYRRVFL